MDVSEGTKCELIHPPFTCTAFLCFSRTWKLAKWRQNDYSTKHCSKSTSILMSVSKCKARSFVNDSIHLLETWREHANSTANTCVCDMIGSHGVDRTHFIWNFLRTLMRLAQNTVSKIGYNSTNSICNHSFLWTPGPRDRRWNTSHV